MQTPLPALRGAVGAVAYFGANRMAEIKEIKMSGKIFLISNRYLRISYALLLNCHD